MKKSKHLRLIRKDQEIKVSFVADGTKVIGQPKNPLDPITILEDKINLRYYGTYRMGLLDKEIKIYLRQMARGTKYSKYSTSQLIRKFHTIAGCNTMAIAPTGESLMYRHDVSRFADKMFCGIPTYFD
ncbi:hypothetical protein LCGC14_2219810 [marine sediment metagenome]|uniref:Uncharacterized protein n=1 Tax=marine sediment metagenome TaxID=412755 RepID=A0A0F9DYV9_9ZZZZ